MGLRPTNGHESPSGLSFRSRMRERNLLLIFFSQSRFLVATLLGMTERLDDFRRSEARDLPWFVFNNKQPAAAGLATPRRPKPLRRSKLLSAVHALGRRALGMTGAPFSAACYLPGVYC
jgi:hypothetical protein